MRRTERINNLLREELSELLKRELEDPRLRCFITITEVRTSKDLSHAKVYVSLLDREREEDIMKALTGAESFLRRELGEKLHLRRIPRLEFEIDRTIERAVRLTSIIERASKEIGVEE